MKIHRTTALADKVLAALRKQLARYRPPVPFADPADAYPYLNGRERGWTVSVGPDLPAFTFSEHRNSDVVVVYEDPEWGMFKGNGGTPSDAAFEGRRFFRTPAEAADHVAARIKALLDAKAVADAVRQPDAAVAR